MEGYFPICVYCKLANVSEDTAYHRTIRNQVPNFKDENGRMYIYFSDELLKIPEDFVSVPEYCKINYVTPAVIYRRIKLGLFKPEDLYYPPRDVYRAKGIVRIYIRKTAKYIRPTDKYCPEGCIPLADWCEENNISRNSGGQLIIHGKLKPVYNNGFVYVKKGTELPTKRKYKKNS